MWSLPFSTHSRAHFGRLHPLQCSCSSEILWSGQTQGRFLKMLHSATSSLMLKINFYNRIALVKLQYTNLIFFNQFRHCQIVTRSCDQPRNRICKSQGHAWSLESALSAWRPQRRGTICHCTCAPLLTLTHLSGNWKLTFSAYFLTWSMILCRLSHFIVFYSTVFYSYTLFSSAVS